MNAGVERKNGLTGVEMHYCAGCTHGIVHRLLAEVLVDLDVLETTVGIAPVGCSIFASKYFDCDMVEALHGRAPAVATGVKSVLPDNVVFTYQGDGDLAAIGTAETIHAAARGENITIIFINNATYGMTGGQMAPTTLLGQHATTAPEGRKRHIHGCPINVAELLSQLDGTAYVERVAVNNPRNVRAAKKAIRHGIEIQLDRKGFSLIEVLSTCPTNWKMTPLESMRWLEEHMIPQYPLGIFKDKEGGAR